MRPLTTSQVMKLLGIGRTKVRNLLAGKSLEYFTMPNSPDDPKPRRYVNPDKLLAFAKERGFAKPIQDAIEALIPKE